MYDVEYLKILEGDAERQRDEAKVNIHLSTASLSAILVSVTSIIVSSILILLKDKPATDVLSIIVLCFIVVFFFGFLIHIAKCFHLFIENQNHRHHKENHEIIFQLLRKAMHS